jgi:hypothetical protein
MQFTGHRRRGGGVIDEARPPRHAGKCTLLPQHHRTQVVVVADAGEHEVGPRAGLRRGVCAGTAIGLDPGLGLGRGAVVDRHLVAGTGQVPGHGITHHAKTQKGHSAGRNGIVGFGRSVHGHMLP